jgi:hypothetical protein
VHVIDYYENSGAGIGIDHYAKHLQSLPYVWGTHNGPHDLEAHQFAAGGKSTREQAASLGLKFNVLEREDVQGSIFKARSFMGRCWFDKAKCAHGLNALASYHYAFDDKRKCFQDAPYHDWSSNAADAFRYLAMGHKHTRAKEREPEIRIQSYDRDAAGVSWLST